MPSTRIAVTGAAGFVGANLVRALLAAGIEVHALVRRDTDLWRLRDVASDVAVKEAELADAASAEAVLSAIAPDAVVNLMMHRRDATSVDRVQAVATNLLGLAHLLEAARSLDVRRVVHFGSSTEHGNPSPGYDESSPLAPATFYGVTKAAATMLCRQAASAHGQPVVVLRPYTIYGPWQPPARLVPTAIVAALRGSGLAISEGGPGRDWVFVGDVVDACMRALVAEGLDGEVIDLGTGTLSTNAEVAAAVERATGRTLTTHPAPHLERPWDGAMTLAPTAKAQARLGWKARHDLDDGVSATAAWLEAHMHLYAGRTSSGTPPA